jgi:hypothetical protein
VDDRERQPERDKERQRTRERVARWLGKRAVIGLRSAHYLCGTVKSLEGLEVRIAISSEEQRISIDDVESIGKAAVAQADFFK